MNFAKQFREAISVLFGSRRIEDLKDQIEDLKLQRDQANGRASRLELMLLTPREPKLTIPRKGVPLPVGGRKTWIQVQAEDMERQRKEAEQEAAAKKAEGSN